MCYFADLYVQLIVMLMDDPNSMRSEVDKLFQNKFLHINFVAPLASKKQT